MAKKKSVQNKIDFDLSQLEADMKKRLDAIPALERYKVLDAVVSEATKPIVRRARTLAPRSSKTGTALKRSASQRQKADWNYPLWKTIKKVVRKYQKRTAVGVVGPEWPKGNKAYFNTSPSGRKQVLWGRRTGKTVPQIRNWIVQAFDETKTEQTAAISRTLQKKTDEMWLNK